jgi:hypothetical protein
MKLLRLACLFAALVVLLTLSATATAATTTNYHATFVEVGGAVAGGSCGSATISEVAHVARQCVTFDACGPNCEVRTITFDDGSTLLIHESIVDVISPGQSSAAAANAPIFFQITQTIAGGTGRFAGATGSGTGRVNLAANALITAAGTITIP